MVIDDMRPVSATTLGHLSSCGPPYCKPPITDADGYYISCHWEGSLNFTSLVSNRRYELV